MNVYISVPLETVFKRRSGHVFIVRLGVVIEQVKNAYHAEHHFECRFTDTAHHCYAQCCMLIA